MHGLEYTSVEVHRDRQPLVIQEGWCTDIHRLPRGWTYFCVHRDWVSTLSLLFACVGHTTAFIPDSIHMEVFFTNDSVHECSWSASGKPYHASIALLLAVCNVLRIPLSSFATSNHRGFWEAKVSQNSSNNGSPIASSLGWGGGD